MVLEWRIFLCRAVAALVVAYTAIYPAYAGSKKPPSTAAANSIPQLSKLACQVAVSFKNCDQHPNDLSFILRTKPTAFWWVILAALIVLFIWAWAMLTKILCNLVQNSKRRNTIEAMERLLLTLERGQRLNLVKSLIQKLPEVDSDMKAPHTIPSPDLF